MLCNQQITGVYGVAVKDIQKFFSTEDKFAAYSGIELVEVQPGWSKTRMEIKPFHLNGAKTVHGGAIFTLADFAFAVASNSRGSLAMGINTSMMFVKAGINGHLYAEAKELSCNSKLASYSVTVTDDSGDTVAVFHGMVYRKKESILPK